MRFPMKRKTIENPLEGHVAFCLKIFEFDVRLPLYLFVQEFLVEVNLDPTQFPSNGWGILLGC